MPISQQEQSLRAQIAHAGESIVLMEKKLRTLDDELARLSGQRERYQLLDEICTSLEKLGSMGAAGIFREATGSDPARQLQQVREAVAQYQHKITAIEKSRSVLQADIHAELASVRLLNDRLEELQGAAGNLEIRGEVKRQSRELPFRASVLPWSVQGADERRFRKILFTIVFFAVVFGGIIPILRPPVEKSMGIVVPERIARIIKKKQEAKIEEQKPKAEEKKEEKPEEKKTPLEKKPEPAVAEAQKPRSTVETKGVLAFKENLAGLMEDSSQMRIGADARITHKADRAASGGPQRSIIVAHGAGGSSSGGINTSTLSRQGGSGGGQRIVSEGVKFTRIENEASAAAAQPLSRGAGPARTDEEIQIVFDRYKSALYRIYNRELRNNPTLKGKMVLRIVIEPDGQVSSCVVKSTDLTSPAFSAEIVNRVLNFNFGPKAGVPAITILYPIDFLPAG